MSIVRAPRPKGQYTVLRNDVLRDTRLSFRALGILVEVLSRPDNWRTRAEVLAAQRKEGRDAVRVALGELKQAGYLAHIKTRCGKTGQITTVSMVYDEPRPSAATSVGIPQTPEPEKPHPGFPVTGLPTTGEPTVGGSVALRTTETNDGIRSESAAASSSSPRFAPSDEDDTRKSQARAKRTATRRQREELQARQIISEHGETQSQQEADVFLASLYDAGVKHVGAYLQAVVDDDGEDKVAELVESAWYEFVGDGGEVAA